MDVTGLVLSIGEKHTQRAVQSLKRQTVLPKDIVVIRGVTPFHKAMNKGIAGIKTPWFVQCDADMVLDPDCIAVMRQFAKDDVGVVIAYLQDEMLGRIQAVKLFRTKCVSAVRFSNHVSPDTNLIGRLKDCGWRYVFAKRTRGRYGHTKEVLGAHRPEYSSLYTFSKFKLEGARMRKRGVFQEITNCMKKLSGSAHPMAPVALIGLCKGIFDEVAGDGLTRYKKSGEFKVLENYRNSKKTKDDFIIRRNYKR